MIPDAVPSDEPRRGLRGCPRCRRFSMTLIDTNTLLGFMERGHIDGIRTFECTTDGCGYLAREILVCSGVTTRRTSRRFNRERDGTQVDASEVDVIVFKASILVKT